MAAMCESRALGGKNGTLTGCEAANARAIIVAGFFSKFSQLEATVQTERAIALMNELDLDAVVATSWDNLTHLSGAYVYTQRAIPTRRSALLLTRDGKATYIFCGIEDSLVRDQTWVEDLRGYHEFAEDPTDMLISLLHEKNLGGKRIGLERQFLGADLVSRIERGGSNATYVDNFDFFKRLRVIKTPAEIALMQKAATATRKAHDATFAAAKPGDTEKELANNLLHHLFQLGADETAFITVATGSNTTRAHHLADDTRIEPGQLVRTDMGGFFNGYFSDLGRTYVVGEPTKSQAEGYRKLRQLQEEVISHVTVGRRVSELFEICRKAFAREGLNFHMPHIGHSIGLELHEWPVIHPAEHAVIEENMIFNIEPVYVDEKTSELFFVEDLVCVTKDGPRLLTGGLAPPEIPVIA